MVLVKREPSPLLLEKAIEYGVKNNVLDGSFVLKVQEEGAAMTVRLAQKLYSEFYEVNLRQSMGIVLGVCNYGLTLMSEGGDVQHATYLLKSKKGIVPFFVRAVEAVKELSENTQYHYLSIDRLTNQDCLEILAVSDTADWQGDVEFARLHKKATERMLFIDFLDWFSSSVGIRTDVAFCDLSDDGRDKRIEFRKKMLETGILSTLVFEKPQASLSGEDVVKLMGVLDASDSDTVLQNQLSSFSKMVPEKFAHLAIECCSAVWQSMEKALKQADFIGYLVKNYNVQVDSDEAVRLQRDLLENASKAEILEAISELTYLDTATFSFEPYIDALSRHTLTVGEMLHLSGVCDFQFTGVNWGAYSYKEVLYVLRGVDASSHGNLIRSIFSGVRDNRGWWKNAPVALLLHFMRDPEMVYSIKQCRSVSAVDAHTYASKRYLLFLLDEDEYYEYCFDSLQESVQRLLTITIEVLRKNSVPEDEIALKLVRVVQKIINNLHDEPDAVSDDNLFFDSVLREVVQSSAGDFYKKIASNLCTNS